VGIEQGIVDQEGVYRVLESNAMRITQHQRSFHLVSMAGHGPWEGVFTLCEVPEKSLLQRFTIRVKLRTPFQ